MIESLPEDFRSVITPRCYCLAPEDDSHALFKSIALAVAPRIELHLEGACLLNSGAVMSSHAQNFLPSIFHGILSFWRPHHSAPRITFYLDLRSQVGASTVFQPALGRLVSGRGVQRPCRC